MYIYKVNILVKTNSHKHTQGGKTNSTCWIMAGKHHVYHAAHINETVLSHLLSGSVTLIWLEPYIVLAMLHQCVNHEANKKPVTSLTSCDLVKSEVIQRVWIVTNKINCWPPSKNCLKAALINILIWKMGQLLNVVWHDLLCTFHIVIYNSYNLA